MKTMAMILGLATALTVSMAQAATELVVCLKEQPTYTTGNNGKRVAQIPGPAALVNVDGGKVTWIGAGGYVYVTAQANELGEIITKVSGSNPTVEPILSVNMNSMIYETYPATFARLFKIELADSLGGNGKLELNLYTRGKTDFATGKATWNDQYDAKETLSYCTTRVAQ